MAKTLYEKLFDAHVVYEAENETPLLYIDRHLVHEVTSPQAFDGLRAHGRSVRQPGKTFATMDHNVSTQTKDINACGEMARIQMQELIKNCKEFGVELYDLNHPYQGIVHVMGPEQGVTLPGMTIVCGDSHTATHGAFGALAFGIGTSEVEHVLATQTLKQGRAKTMKIEVQGKAAPGITAKDIVLAIIGKTGSAGGTGHVVEFCGDVMLSIGGANNAPLAASCKNVDDLMQHYYDIVDNLNLRVLDFDIEGTWVADQASIERRNLAVKKVQDKWKSEGKDIAIWYTLPILPTGLTPEGMNVLSDAKAKGVELAGVNVMTMDYGNAICQSANTEGQNIHGKCATSAIANLHAQLKGLYGNKSDAEIDAMMGTTPMVGVNDVQGEVFYLSDARLVMQDAQKRNLGMVGIWSIARDLPGGTNLSPEFHGLTKEQAPKYAFSEIFAPFTKQ